MTQITRQNRSLTTGPLRRFVAALTNPVLDVLYPAHCLVCGRSLGPGGPRMCDGCWLDLEVIDGHHCIRCGCPSTDSTATCDNCREKPFGFTALRSLAPFTEPMQRLIHGIKYQGRTSAARVLGKRLAEMLLGEGAESEVDLIVPVPLHPSRRRERGYNQSDLIGMALAPVLRLPLDCRSVLRTRATTTQTALDLPGRAGNVAGAFKVRRSERICGRRVLLVDDVVTTGATGNACSEALMVAGAVSVSVAALASPYFESDKSQPSARALGGNRTG